MQLKDKGISTAKVIGIVGASLLVLVASLVFLWHSSGAGEHSFKASAALGEEEKAYLRQIEFPETRMSAAENFLGDRVTYLDAQVTNRGAKTVRRLDVDLTFVDMLNQVVLREAAHPVTGRTPPLKPGETRAFRVSLEHIPVEWNQAAPAIAPVYIQF